MIIRVSNQSLPDGTHLYLFELHIPGVDKLQKVVPMTHYELDHSHKGHPVETCHPVAERMSLHVEYIAHVPEREEPLGHKGKNVEEADPSYHTQIESNRRTV